MGIFDFSVFKKLNITLKLDSLFKFQKTYISKSNNLQEINRSMPLGLSQLQFSPPENEEDFERLCLDLYKSEFGKQTQRNGRRGQTQDGVDIFVQDQYIGIQCKKKELNGKITKEELFKEIAKAKKFQPSLKEFILATSCKRDANIQKEARVISDEHKAKKLFSVQVHSWEEIRELLDKYPFIYKTYYPEINITSQDFKQGTFLHENHSHLVKAIQSDSIHSELNRIKTLIEDKPKTSFDLLKQFERDKWTQLDDKEKYRVLTNMGVCKIKMQENMEASQFFIKALTFNKNDEEANANCAIAYFIRKDFSQSKKYVQKVKNINPLNIMGHTLEIQIQNEKGKPLKEIIDKIPEDLKSNYKLAHVLCHINIKEKKWIEAQKWLNIFYKDIDQKGNIEILSFYADMSLTLILEKDNIFVARLVPHNLRNKIKEIINIYMNIVRSESELKKFRPYWYIHYAIALELNGQLDTAIEVLEEGRNLFPNLLGFPAELGRLLAQRGDIRKSIFIMEEITSPSSKFRETENEAVDDISLRLAGLYFYNNNKIEKGIQLLNKIKDSASKKNKIKAQRLLVFRLINIKQIDRAEKELNLFIEDNENSVFDLILKSRIEDHKGNTDGKRQYLKEAYNLSQKNNVHIGDLKHLADELYYSKIYEMCEPLLEQITNRNLNHHPEIFNLLHTYFENGEIKKTIVLAKDLTKIFPDRIEPVNTLFLTYEGLGDRKKAIQCYENFINLNPDNSLIKIDLILAYILDENFLEAEKLLNSGFNLNQLPAHQINKISIAYAQIGNIKKALETQYQCVKNNPKRLEPQSVYFELFTFLNHPGLFDILNVEKESKAPKPAEYKPDNNIFLRPKKVGMDCYIRIKDIESLEETEIIIEKEADIYTPNHELSQALLEKKAGDIILFLDKKYQIMEIKSKYKNKYDEIVKEAEKRFASKTFLKSVHIPKSADAKKILQTLEKKFSYISKQQEGLDKLFQFYSDGKATVGFIAKISGRHSIEIIGELIFSQTDKFISAIPAWENDNKTQELLDEKTNILIDFSSLIMIHQLKLEKYMEESKFKLHICQSTIDSLKKYIQEMALHSKDGRLTLVFDKEGHFRKSFVQAKIIKQDLNFWMKIKIWAEKHCQIKPLSTDIILSREQRREKEKVLGKEFFDPLLAAGGNVILLCEDAILRKFAEHEFSVSGARLFDLIEYFEKQVIIDNNQAVKFKAQLVQLNQTYIPIDHNILLFLLKEAEYSVNDTGFQRGLFFLGPIFSLQGVIEVVANFLVDLFQEPSLLFHSIDGIAKEVLNKSFSGRNASSEYIARRLIQSVQSKTLLLPIHQKRICSCIQEWLNGRIY